MDRGDVMHDQAPQPDDEPGSPVDDRWADLADLILIIAREIQFRGYTDERAVPLSPSESMVMRHLLGDPSAPPSRIAAATGLQRTNLSTVLRGLETKGLIERHTSTDDRRGVTVHVTERGRANYTLVRREWATAVSAAGHETGNLDPALALLSAVETGLVAARSGTPPATPAA
jgi:DNA-binding MarR family transcriptional regulator